MKALSWQTSFILTACLVLGVIWLTSHQAAVQEQREAVASGSSSSATLPASDSANAVDWWLNKAMSITEQEVLSPSDGVPIFSEALEYTALTITPKSPPTLVRKLMLDPLMALPDVGDSEVKRVQTVPWGATDPDAFWHSQMKGASQTLREAGLRGLSR